MTIWRNGAALGALALLVAGVATGQQRPETQRPESLLPPGFGEPAPTPAPGPAPSGTAPSGAATAPLTVQPLPGEPTPEPTPTPSATPAPVDLSAYELPDYARRSLRAVGTIGATSGGIEGPAFGTARGHFTERLMRRLDAPLPSRWLSIALRRALVSRVETPRDVDGADFAAERAWLLLRMGEADAARALVQSVDVADYTPKLFDVAMQAMLANGDPAGLCPLVEPALAVSVDKAWVFARAMCAALAGKPAEAGRLYDAARRRTGRTIDALLAEKVVGAGAGGRRAVSIEWAGVDRMTAWRFGLASATGVDMPADLLGATRPQVALWRATQPMLAPAARVPLAEAAAARGVLSSAALVDLLGEVEASDSGGSPQSALAADLRAAVTEGSDSDRLATMRRLWGDPKTAAGRYARLVMLAPAAARIAPSNDTADDGAPIIASMLSAGMDRTAMRWARAVAAGSDGWAMLALADPDGGRVTGDAVESYAGSAGEVKGRLLLAGLAGLGRLPLAEAQALAEPLGVQFGAENSWVRAIRDAADRGEAASVLLLLAVGMQTTDWRGVPPEVLYHGVAALREVGLEGEARMIAAEAIART